MIDPTSYIAPGAILIGDVTLAARASVWYNCVVRADSAPVHIGLESNIQDLSVIHVDEGAPCRVGNRVGVGHGVILHGCTVEDESLVGMGAILLNHVRIGKGSFVAAGAVVKEGTDVPPGSLVAGVPARIVRPIDDTLTARIRATWEHYVEAAKRHKSGVYDVLTG